jgi:hypothetical protein
MRSNVKLQDEEVAIKRVFDRISTSFIFISKGFAALQSYFTLDTEQTKKIKTHPLEFAKITYQYFMIIQFCKLFETSKDKKQADSSMIKLNELIKNKYDSKYISHGINQRELDSILSSPTVKLCKTLRDKTYAHADNHAMNQQLKFKFLSKDQLADFKITLLDCIKIFNRMNAYYGMDVTFHNFYDDSTPANFLRNYFREKEYYYKNILISPRL